MLWRIAILLVIAQKLGLHVVVGVAKVDCSHGHLVAQRHRAEIAYADASLVDILVGADA